MKLLSHGLLLKVIYLFFSKSPYHIEIMVIHIRISHTCIIIRPLHMLIFKWNKNLKTSSPMLAS